MAIKENRRYSGIVVQNRAGKYLFKTQRGSIFDIVQDQQAKDLCEKQMICVFEQLETKNTDDKFGRIIKVLGNVGNLKAESDSIIETYQLDKETTREAQVEVDKTPNVVSAKECNGVADLRYIPFVTIDPDTAKDYDDAVYACKNPDGTYTLKVAIANVAHYVGADSALFQHAVERGNSTYLGSSSTVFPMLPEKLSNGICSLNENVDRLVMCTTCTIKPTGELVNFSIEPAVINSRHRLTYKEADYLYFGENAVGDNLDHSDVVKKTEDVRDSLSNLYDVSQILYKARMKRGSFDINSPELEFKISPNFDDVIGYSLGHNEKFTSVIEETAVITNEIWGEVADRAGFGFAFRDHKQIEECKIGELRNKLKQFDLNVPKGVNNKGLQRIINLVRGKRIEEYVVSQILKSMDSAFYSTTNIGHAGLGIATGEDFKSQRNVAVMNRGDMGIVDSARMAYFKQTGSHNGLYFDGDIAHRAYGQTTSPIRRLSDLVNQLQMISVIKEGVPLFKRNQITDLCDRMNYCEKNSAQAETDYSDMLCAHWAINNIGKSFDNCTIVNFGEKHSEVKTADGLKVLLPFDYTGIKRKYLRIGKRLDNIVISQVKTNPARIECLHAMAKDKLVEDYILE